MRIYNVRKLQYYKAQFLSTNIEKLGFFRYSRKGRLWNTLINVAPFYEKEVILTQKYEIFNLPRRKFREFRLYNGP